MTVVFYCSSVRVVGTNVLDIQASPRFNLSRVSPGGARL